MWNHVIVSVGGLDCLSSSGGESADDWSGSLGEMVWPGHQHQGGCGGHQRGRLPVPGCFSGAVWRLETSTGPAFLRIL